MTLLLILMALMLICADQLVKYWAVNTLQEIHTMDFLHLGSVKIIDLTYLENDGAIFGSMSGQRWFLIGFTSLVIIAGIIAFFLLRKRSGLLSLALAMFVAGGIGNLIDRIRYGYVVDMFEVKLFHFAIFNVADICVTVAFVLLIIYAMFVDPKIEKSKKAAAGTPEKAAADE